MCYQQLFFFFFFFAHLNICFAFGDIRGITIVGPLVFFFFVSGLTQLTSLSSLLVAVSPFFRIPTLFPTPCLNLSSSFLGLEFQSIFTFSDSRYILGYPIIVAQLRNVVLKIRFITVIFPLFFSPYISPFPLPIWLQNSETEAPSTFILFSCFSLRFPRRINYLSCLLLILSVTFF